MSNFLLDKRGESLNASLAEERAHGLAALAVEVVVNCLKELVLHGTSGLCVHKPGAAIALAGAASVDLVEKSRVVNVNVDRVDTDYRSLSKSVSESLQRPLGGAAKRRRDVHAEARVTVGGVPPKAEMGRFKKLSPRILPTIFFVQRLDLPQVLEFMGPDIIVEL